MDCERLISDGKNWLCQSSGDAAQTITLQMTYGRPAPNPDGPTKPFHALPKWRWWLLRLGLSFNRDADI